MEVSFSQRSRAQMIPVCLRRKEVEQRQQSGIFYLIEVIGLVRGGTELARLVQTEDYVQIIVHLKIQQTSIIVGAHSFPRKILPNSAGQLAKFRGSQQQNCPNSVAGHAPWPPVYN